MPCDLCGDSYASGNPLPAEMMQFIAAQGFNPFSEPAITRVAGAPDYSSWLQRVASNRSGWALCATCLEAIWAADRQRLDSILADAPPPSIVERVGKLFSGGSWWLWYLGPALILTVVFGGVESWLYRLLIMLGAIGIALAGWIGFRSYLAWENTAVSSLPLLGGEPPSRGQLRGMVLALASLAVIAVAYVGDLIWLMRSLPAWIVGAGLGAVCLVNTLAVSIGAAIERSGHETEGSHEWRLLDRGGKPAARMGPASRKEVYDHYHGWGSWEKRCRRQASFLNVLTVIGSPAAALLLVHFNLHPLESTGMAVGLGLALTVTSLLSFLIVAFKVGG